MKVTAEKENLKHANQLVAIALDSWNKEILQNKKINHCIILNVLVLTVDVILYRAMDKSQLNAQLSTQIKEYQELQDGYEQMSRKLANESEKLSAAQRENKQLFGELSNSKDYSVRLNCP